MPTYEYKCRQCAHQFEVVQSFSAKPLKKCKECGGQLGKVFGSIGIAFKGSGFYRTDSRSGSAATVGGKSELSEKGKSEKSDDAGKSEKSGKAGSGSGATAGGEGKKDTGNGAKSDRSDAAPKSKPTKAKESAA
jgi:putative FmdB family regulatory protein